MKVPKARKQPSGNWFIRLRLGGASYPITAATEKECIKRAQLIKAEYLSGKRSIKAGNITLSQAIDNYIERRVNRKEKPISPATVKYYRLVQNNYFQDVMNKPITSKIVWQDEVDAFLETHSAKTVKNATAFIRSVLKENNVDMGDIDAIRLVKRNPVWLDPEQIFVFMSAIKGQPWEIEALLALHGLRRSEIFAITWDKIDLKKEQIIVNEVMVYDENNQQRIKKGNKTDASTRAVPIIIPRLSELLSASDRSKPLIYHKSMGNLYMMINQTCEEAGLPKVGIHGLRHSFASLCYHLHIPELQVMEFGGWADYQTMHGIYTHLARQDREKAISNIRDFYEKKE